MKKTDQLTIVLLLLMTAFFVVIFHLLGHTVNTPQFGRSSVTWMITRRQDYGGRFSHCWLIPIVSICLLWWRRQDLTAASKTLTPQALLVVIAALLLQLISARTKLPRLSLTALILLLWGIPFYLYGWRVARLTIFPCAYLFFCIPLTFLDSLTFPLRLIVSQSATVILNGLGVGTVRVGTAIISTEQAGFKLDVADPCSGLRYFLVLTALAALYAHITQKTLTKQWILFLLAPAIAVIANIVRITAIAIAAKIAGEETALGLYHSASGYIVFIVAVLLLIGLGAIMNINYRDKWNQWKQLNISQS